MKAITLWQPYATAIALHGKDVENRPWPPPESIIGERIAIHAGAKKRDERWGLPDGVAIPEPLPRSAIVATALVRGGLDARVLPSRVIAGGGSLHFAEGAAALWPRLEALNTERWWVGPCGWLLDDVRALTKPIACKGALGLWTVPRDIEIAVLDAELGPLGVTSALCPHGHTKAADNCPVCP